jgi:hypothetical protein
MRRCSKAAVAMTERSKCEGKECDQEREDAKAKQCSRDVKMLR